MAFDSITTYLIIDELKERIIGSKVNKIYMPTKYEVVIHTFGNKGKDMLLINAGSSTPRVHFIKDYNASMNEPYGFCMLLRKYLVGSVITGVEGYEFDRIIKIHFETINLLGEYQNVTLIAEIMGRNSNLILVDDESGMIIDSIKHIKPNSDFGREVIPKIKYEYLTADRLNPLDFNEFVAKDNLKSKPDLNVRKALMSTFNGISPAVLKQICKNIGISDKEIISNLEDSIIDKLISEIDSFFHYWINNPSFNIYKEDSKNKDYLCCDFNIYEGLEKIPFSSPSDMIDGYYQDADRIGRLKVVYSDLYHTITNMLTRERNKLLKREEDIKKAEDSEIYNMKGQLLLTNLYMINRGDKEIEVDNFFTSPVEKIKISLDPSISPSENANKYFKRYNKLSSSVKYLNKLIKDGKEMIYFLESQLLYLTCAKNYMEVEQIRKTLVDMNLMKKSKKKKQVSSKLKKLMYKSKDGTEIYVGRNSIENDELTRKFAFKSDLWFHTKDIPSSHVILRTNEGKYSKEGFMLACKLCVYYSQARDSSNVPVDYTYIKYVKKPSGMKEGKVIYTDNQTVEVKLSEEDIKYIQSLNE